MIKLLTFALALFALVALTSAQCANFPDINNDVCRFGDQERIVVGGEETCIEVNERPFATLSQQCYDLMMEDGKDCSYAIARFFCSGRCPECSSTFDPPCNNLCVDAAAACPKMWEVIACRVARDCTESSTCTSTNINKNRVDDITGLDGDDGDGDGDSDSAPGKPSLTIPIVLAGTLAVYIATALSS